MLGSRCPPVGDTHDVRDLVGLSGGEGKGEIASGHSCITVTRHLVR